MKLYIILTFLFISCTKIDAIDKHNPAGHPKAEVIAVTEYGVISHFVHNGNDIYVFEGPHKGGISVTKIPK